MANIHPTSEISAEPLTRRERAILVHLVEDKSNQEIAALETLALSSVKWYTRQIYAKLGVNRRKEAVTRARELGLLQPAPASIPKNNLPAQLTSFIGRQKEIGELRLLLRKKNTRLLTLTGTGGTGKTRLALQVAGELLDDFSNGVWLVDLAPLADPALVPQTVIAALGQAEQPDKTPMKQLADYLREKKLLLILDNCEHLVEACAELASALLQGAPRLTILASSREILGVAGEIPYRVPPLRMPDPRKSPSLEELAQFEAVQLFVERAQVVSPEFALTPDTAAAVAQITQRLDGIPLAIELAAARLHLLSVGQIAERLTDAFRLLTGGSRTALPRHQTLTALIDWSYNLLSEAERELLRSLSAFAGGWTLEAAEEVCAEGADVLDVLRGLADKSLILSVATPDGEMRYRMLETVRQYAHARLVETGEVKAVRSRHLDFYLRLAERLEPKLRSREQIPTLDALGRELDNLRLALEWALQADVEAELRLASAMYWFWHIRYHWAEGIAWLKRGLEAEGLNPGRRVQVRAKALTALGLMPGGQGTARPIFEEALNLYRLGGQEHSRGMAWAMLGLGKCQLSEDHSAEGQVQVEEALHLFRETGDPHGMAECLYVLGDREYVTAKQKKIFLEALSIDQSNGDSEGTAYALFSLGVCAVVDGDFENAQVEFLASREHYRQVGDPFMVAFDGLVLGYVSQCHGDLEQAALYLEEALAIYREIVDDNQVAYCLFWKGMNACAQGHAEQVVELIVEIGGIAQKTGNPELFAVAFYFRARLVRLEGDLNASRRFAEEGLNAGPDLGVNRLWVVLELGHLALHDGDLERAGVIWREALQIIIRWNVTQWIGFPVDGLAILALREVKLERAARLFGTRQWRGATHFLSPIERAEREASLAEVRAALGDERFTQLREEGQALTFNQVLSLAQAEG